MRKRYNTHIYIIIIMICIAFRVLIALRMSMVQSEILTLRKDELNYLEDNRRYKENLFGGSIIALEKHAKTYKYSYPEKILYLKDPENIAGL